MISTTKNTKQIRLHSIYMLRVPKLHNAITRKYTVAVQAKRSVKTIGRFTTEVENFHGRLAMLGITGCAMGEMVSKVPIVEQFCLETGLTPVQTLAAVTVVTSAFILEALNPVVVKNEEIELDVFSNPGFTLETEILHGRIAMLAFAYVLVGEEIYNRLLL